MFLHGAGDSQNVHDNRFMSDVLSGMSARQKAVPARWLYDHRGSELFELITKVAEYYPTRTERALLVEHAHMVAGAVGRKPSIVEFGSGSSSKTKILLRALQPSAYIPIDISGRFLQQTVSSLRILFPRLQIRPVEGDFTKHIVLSSELGVGPRLGFFPGSTIGNLDPTEAVEVLGAMAETLGRGAYLLLGMDRIKTKSRLLPAYDDSAGSTAAFNLNLLDRINRELGGDIPVQAFRHRATWNVLHSRIEMHLVALQDIAFRIASKSFSMRAGETIHTENSHKYDVYGIDRLLRAGGWTPLWIKTDELSLFSIVLAHLK